MTETTVWQTSRPRAGRRFAPIHESALFEPAIEACRSLSGAHRGLVLVQELAGPYGIPDFTALVGSKGRLEARLKLGVPPLLNEIDAAVIAAAQPRRARTVAGLAQAMQWPSETVKRRLPSLLRSRALREVRPGSFIRAPELQPVGRLYAIETKVSEWAQALRQARAYSAWTDGYVLVMGKLSTVSLASLAPEVESDHGGLVVDGRWVQRPRIRNLPMSKRLWGSEHLIAGIKGLNHQPSVLP